MQGRPMNESFVVCEGADVTGTVTMLWRTRRIVRSLRHQLMWDSECWADLRVIVLARVRVALALRGSLMVRRCVLSRRGSIVRTCICQLVVKIQCGERWCENEKSLCPLQQTFDDGKKKVTKVVNFGPQRMIDSARNRSGCVVRGGVY